MKVNRPDNFTINDFKRKYTSPDSKGEDCANLSKSMKFGTHVGQNILNSFFEGAIAGAQWATIFAKSNMASSRYVI